MYGINTGFGRLSTEVIEPEDLRQLQDNLIMSHSTSVGTPLPINTTRRVVALRINTVLKGCSGISVATFEKLVQFFNSGLVPYLRDQGTYLAFDGSRLCCRGKNPREMPIPVAVLWGDCWLWW